MKYLLLIVLLVLLAGGAFYMLNDRIYQEKQADLSAYTYGEYPYMCANGMRFDMLPASDMSTIYLRPGEDSTAPETILSSVPTTEGVRYEGDGVTFIGKGEGVELQVDAETTTCAPVQSQDAAPFNFGD